MTAVKDVSRNATGSPDALVETIVQAVLARLDVQAPEEAAVTSPLVDQPLLTLEDVSSVPRGANLRVGSRTVVTPAARDELAARGVRIIRQEGTPLSEPNAARPVHGDEERHAADIAADLQRHGGVRVVTSPQPHRLSCLLNRYAHISAAAIAQNAESPLQEAGFQPNVLVAPVTSPLPLLRRWRRQLERTYGRKGARR